MGYCLSSLLIFSRLRYTPKVFQYLQIPQCVNLVSSFQNNHLLCEESFLINRLVKVLLKMPCFNLPMNTSLKSFVFF